MTNQINQLKARMNAMTTQVTWAVTRRSRRRGADVANRYVMMQAIVRTYALERHAPPLLSQCVPDDLVRIEAALVALEREPSLFPAYIQRYETLRFQAGDGLAYG